MRKVLIIQHVEHEGPGIIAGALRAFDVDFLKIYRDRMVRSLDGYSALVVLGGPMGVYEEEKYPFLKDEIKLIESAIKKDIPTLGDRLTDANVPWTYYGATERETGYIWSAYGYIRHIRLTPEWE